MFGVQSTPHSLFHVSACDAIDWESCVAQHILCQDVQSAYFCWSRRFGAKGYGQSQLAACVKLVFSVSASNKYFQAIDC
jgi:hypothetical protein